MKTKKCFALLLAGMMSVSLLAGCGADKPAEPTDPTAPTEPTAPAAESDLDYVVGNGKMVIGYTDYAPMNYLGEDGNLTGFDTEFAMAVCQKLGVDPEFVEIVWDTKLIELESKNIDCIWNGMTITDDLKANIAISDPYVQNTQVVITKRETQDEYADFANLEGKTVVLEAGSAAEGVAAEDEHLQKANIVTVNKQTDALLEVKAGTADAAIFDLTMANSMIGEGTDFDDLLICGVFHEENYGIGFRKDSDLRDKVNEIMADMKADGTLKALADKYELSLAA